MYIGVTSNIEQRLKDHVSGNATKFTKDNPYDELVYTEPYSTLSDARRREYQLKGWSQKKKLALIQGNKNLLTELSKSKD